MDNYLLTTHGFTERDTQAILRKMADLRDAKNHPLLDDIKRRAFLHYAIEYMTNSSSVNMKGNIGDLHPIYLELAKRLESKFQMEKGEKSNTNDSKQMELDLWNGCENE